LLILPFGIPICSELWNREWCRKFRNILKGPSDITDKVSWWSP
jgi:hypothetical protein